MLNRRRAIRAVLGGQGRRLALLVVLIYLVALYSLVMPVLFAAVIDQVLPQRLWPHLWLAALAALTLALLRFGLAFVQDYEFQRLRLRAERRVVAGVVGAVLAHPLGPAIGAGRSDIDARLRQWLVHFQIQLTEIVFFVAYAASISLTVLAIIVVVDPIAAAIVAGFGAAHYANFRFHLGRSAREAVTYREARAAMDRDSAAAIRAKRAINAALLDDAVLAALSARTATLVDSARRRAAIAASQGLVQSGLRGALYLALVLVMAPRIDAGTTSLGSLLLLLMLVSFAFEPIYRLNQVTTQFHQAAAQVAPLLPLLELPSPADRAAGAVPSSIVLSGLGRTGTGATIEPGRLCLVRGPSGAGKSTLLDLISGLADPSTGTVRALGPDGSPCPLQPASIAFMPQTALVFEASVADNVVRFEPGADRGAIAALLRELALDRLADTPDALVRPERLSLGERQRLALAQMLYRPAPIMLFDEPTANLDPATEHRCLAAIAARRQGRFIVLVSHAAAAQDIADQVIEVGGA